MHKSNRITSNPIIRRSRRRRRPVLLAAALSAISGLSGVVGIAAAAPAGAASLTPISYQLGWITNAEFAGTYLAQSAGDYPGLKVDILPGGSNPVEPVVVSGKALVGDSNADTVSAAVAAGAPLRIIGARYQNNP